jgi:transposase-like protein
MDAEITHHLGYEKHSPSGKNTGNSRNGKHPKSWQSNWQRVIPFFAYSEEIRKIIYTTNAIESMNNTLKGS